MQIVSRSSLLFVLGVAALCAGCAPQPPASFLRQTEWVERGSWMKADLHLHSTFSDGGHSVSELAAKAAEFGCDAIAITDHADRNLRAATPEYAEAIEIARRQHPRLSIIAGLEWNVPGGDRDVHASVLFPSGPDEFLRLSEFKEQFDGLGRSSAESDVAAAAFEWLEARGTGEPAGPLVIQNHPSRRLTAATDVLPSLRRWRQSTNCLIAVEGGPGHQLADPPGAYRGALPLIDRWDPVVAEPGGVWDTLLNEGEDLWGAVASSNFHNPLQDAWPGQFSETWLYVPERSVAGVLRALEAGTFFAAHGHVVRDVRLMVEADGLERPAHAGETIQVVSGHKVTVRLTGQVPERDWSGNANQINVVEFIVTSAQGTRVVRSDVAGRKTLDVSESLSVPPGGMTVRARGRRVRSDGPDLLFYTNAVRVVADETGARSPFPDWPAAAVSIQLPSGSQLLGIALLVLAAGSLLATGCRATPSNRVLEVQTSGTVDAPPRRGHYAATALFFTLLAIYGSLVPLEFRELSWEEAVEQFRAVPFLDLGIGHRADWVANILLFVPISAFWLATLLVDHAGLVRKLVSVPLVLACCWSMSVALEFSQQWFRKRTVSQNDILAECIGSVLGVGLWLLLGPQFTRWLRRATCDRSPGRQLDWLLQAYALGLLIYSVLPLDLVVAPDELARKYREGKLVLVPYWQYDFGPAAWWVRLTDIGIYMPIGALAARLRAENVSRLRPVGSSLAYGVAFVLLVEVCQIFVYSRYSSATDVIGGALGVFVGIFIAQRWRGTRLLRSGLTRREKWFRTGTCSVLILLHTAILAYSFWWPFDFSRSPQEFEQSLAALWRVPFAAMYYGSEFQAATLILRKSVSFAPLGFLFAHLLVGWDFSPLSRRVLASVAIVVCTAIGYGIEAGQAASAVHIADITDVLLYSLGSGLGLWIRCRLGTIGPKEMVRDTIPPPSLGTWFRGVFDSVRESPRRLAVALVMVLAICGAALYQSERDSRGHPGPAHKSRSFAERTGSYFAAPSVDLDRSPIVTRIEVPDFEGAYAIWGATGRDDRGHLWFGVSATDVETPSAHLFEYIPEEDRVIDRGNVVSQLKRNGVYRPGEGQMKIHSKICQADDGYLYFASMDEEGERADGSRLPIWGSHLWRLRPGTSDWEHLFSAPEGLIAVSCTGRWVYALGLFDHVLYQYDTQTGQVRSIRVGAVGGHISRNFVSDDRGHAYVPRLRYVERIDANTATGGTPQLEATLVEFDTELNVVGETPLDHYVNGNRWNNHGMTSFVHLADRSIVFATSRGHLYRIVPAVDGPARVTAQGWFHPEGPAYAPSLFTNTGEQTIAGVIRSRQGFEWAVYDLETGTSRLYPLPLDEELRARGSGLLLYGSVSRDDHGAFYVVGWYKKQHRHHPLLLKLDCARP